jgi:hypothetical protein
VQQLGSVEQSLTRAVAFESQRFLAIALGRWKLGAAGEAADLCHLPLDAFAEILQQMEAICDLPGLKRPLPDASCIEPAAVAAYYFDFRTLLDPPAPNARNSGFAGPNGPSPRAAMSNLRRTDGGNLIKPGDHRKFNMAPPQLQSRG